VRAPIISRHAKTDCPHLARPEDSLTPPLRDGAGGSLGGIALRLGRDAEGWRIAAAGRLEVRDNGDLIVAGGSEFRRHPSPYR
jgi:hypothetical protein